MTYGIRLEVWGDWACFTRPEMKVERVSYDVMTPSAARAIVEAVYWKPAIKWKIDKIHVINEIRFTNIKRNEVSSVVSAGKPYIDVTQDRQQRFSMLLKDVRYVIEAHFELDANKAGADDTKEKHISIAKRRMGQGQAFNLPYFGCREFAANFRLLEDDEPLPQSCYKDIAEKDLGFMLYDIDFDNMENGKQAKFFRAGMKNGVIDLTKCEVLA
jgi:CRISPR-associated protein Cas5d